MTEDSAQRYLSNDRPGGGFWNALDQPVTDALVASAPKRAGSAENGVAHTTETPANSPIHARLSFGTGRGQGLRLEATYNNTTNRTLRFGLLSVDEMMILFGAYYVD